jgi:hypothetical protein
MPARDEFTKETKDILAKRVGLRCSNPNCRRLTSGPQVHPRKAVNIGVAAHIAAAAPGGPRYDDKMRPEERCDIENAVWLCQNCAKLIDNDPSRYTTDLVRRWRRLSEEAAMLSVESIPTPTSTASDDDLIRFYASCFDRPAFQDLFHQEGSMEAFDRAIEDTITALNRSRYDLALTQGALRVGQDDGRRQWYCINDHALALWMDETRAQAITIIAELCKEAGVQPPHDPHLRRPRW